MCDRMVRNASISIGGNLGYSKTCHFHEALESARDAESILHILMQAQPKVYRPPGRGLSTIWVIASVS